MREHSEFEIDVLDPNWGTFESIMARRQDYFSAMRHLDDLSRRLTEEAYNEYRMREQEFVEEKDKD